MKRYWLTGKTFKTTPTARRLENGWTESELILTACEICSRSNADRGFFMREVWDRVQLLMAVYGLTYAGVTTDMDDYKHIGERIVRGRFGNMHERGFFSEYPTATVTAKNGRSAEQLSLA